MIYNIIDIGFAFGYELISEKENDQFKFTYFFSYCSLNQFNNQEGETIKYEVQEKIPWIPT